MIRAEYHADGTYIVRMDVPDQHAVKKISVGFGIPMEATIVALINRGLDSLSMHLQREADKVTKKRQSDNSDYGGD